MVSQMVKNLPAVQKTHVQYLDQEDPMEEGPATHSSILASRIPWTEEPGRLQSMGPQRVGHDWATNTHTHTHTHNLVTEMMKSSVPLSGMFELGSTWLGSELDMKRDWSEWILWFPAWAPSGFMVTPFTDSVALKEAGKSYSSASVILSLSFWDSQVKPLGAYYLHLELSVESKVKIIN